MNILLIGRGRVGTALRRALDASAQHRVVAVGRRWRPSSVHGAEAVVLAVSDDSIELVAEEIAPDLQAGATVLHCAGARGVEELRAC